MPDSVNDEQLKIFKLKIKTWESEFTKFNHRKPGKDDIRQAPSEIKNAYKSYWTLKNKRENTSINKDDVWSEKLNKGYKETITSKSDGETLKKFCNRIKEKYSTISTKVDEEQQSVLTKQQSSANKPLEFDVSKKYANESIASDSIHELDNSEFEMQLLKPAAKIVKLNAVHKKVNSVNILTSAVDLNKLKNNLSYNINLDRGWLDRCDTDPKNSPCDIVISPSPVKDNSQNGAVEHLGNDDVEFSCNSNAGNLGDEANYIDNSQINISSFIDTKQELDQKNQSFYLDTFTTNSDHSKKELVRRTSNFDSLSEVFLSNVKFDPKIEKTNRHFDLENISTDCDNSRNVFAFNNDSFNSGISRTNSNDSGNELVCPKSIFDSDILITDSEVDPNRSTKIYDQRSESNSSKKQINSCDIVLDTKHVKHDITTKQEKGSETEFICRKSIFDEESLGSDYVNKNSFIQLPSLDSNKIDTLDLSGLLNDVIESSDKVEISADVVENGKSRKRKLTRNATGYKTSAHLERKMAAGTLNENFVRVNIKKKKFSRGHRTVNVRKLKWQKWKVLKNSGRNSGNMTVPSACFKCGQIGHWARNCNAQSKEEEASEVLMDDIDDPPLPTLEEAAELAKKSHSNLSSAKVEKTLTLNQAPPNQNEEYDALEKLCVEVDAEMYACSEKITSKSVKPIFDLMSDGKPIETPNKVFEALHELGYTSFYKGQEETIMRILSGLSTLVVLPTGSGKTLCYQLPAYMYAKKYNCVALVVSPLVSLMEDQVTGLAAGLHAVCLHSGMTDIQRNSALEDLSEGKAQILLVSPEAVISQLAYKFNLPPISFACIDEAHCLSQWSHNFRPSYLQLYKVLTQRLNIKCILGLTATANLSTIQEITAHLGIDSTKESVVGTTGIPENLHLSASRDKDRDKALIQLLCGDRFSNCSSIIIYCIRRDETERLAALIRTCLQDQLSSAQPPAKKPKSKSKKRNFLWTAEAYHAGLQPSRRRSIQKQFMTGKLRVVIATIAFGMGLDKRDVRAVLHYNMPKSFESYVQEIGRAGRDGLDSHCHLFLDNEEKDVRELKRHIYSNSTDRYVIRKLLRKVFVPCACKSSGERTPEVSVFGNSGSQNSYSIKSHCPKHEIAFCISDAVQELDLKEENIWTLLCYLELNSKKWIEILPPTYATCSIRCYAGPKQLRSLALKSAPVAAAFALDSKKGKNLENIAAYQFQVVEVASSMGWNTSLVKRELKQLEWNDQKRKTGVIIEFSDLAFHLNAPGNLSDDELDEVLDFLHEKVMSSEEMELNNLKSLFSIFKKYSFPHYWACCDEAHLENSQGIKEAINHYFEETGGSTDMDCQNSLEENVAIVDEDYIRSTIKDLICTNHDQNFTGRAIARIFHGIDSPCYQAKIWGSVRKFWRCLLHVDFHLLVKLANEELKNLR